MAGPSRHGNTVRFPSGHSSRCLTVSRYRSPSFGPSRVRKMGMSMGMSEAQQLNALYYMRIPIYPAGDSDSNPATHSDPFPATCTDMISAGRRVPAQQVYDGHLMARGFRSRL